MVDLLIGNLPLEPFPSDPDRQSMGHYSGVISATNDREAVNAYLRHAMTHPATRRGFMHELARWSWFMDKIGISLGQACLNDIERYVKWLSLPSGFHEEEDIGVRAPLFLGDGKLNPMWRPFIKHEDPDWKPKLTTVAKQISYLSGFYSWLARSGYLKDNPWSLRSTRMETDSGLKLGDVDDSAAYLKALSFDSVMALFEYLRSDDYQGSKANQAADLWLCNLLFWTAHRVGVIPYLTFDHLLETDSGLELAVVGKGLKTLRQAWPDAMHDQLGSYRKELGLSWPANSWDSRHLFVGIARKGFEGKPISTTSIYNRVRKVGDRTCSWLRRTDPDRLSSQQLAKLAAMTPHSFRHTYATIALNNFLMDIHDVKTHLGHSSIVTTEIYYHVQRRGSMSQTRSIECYDSLRALSLSISD